MSGSEKSSSVLINARLSTLPILSVTPLDYDVEASTYLHVELALHGEAPRSDDYCRRYKRFAHGSQLVSMVMEITVEVSICTGFISKYYVVKMLPGFLLTKISKNAWDP